MLTRPLSEIPTTILEAVSEVLETLRVLVYSLLRTVIALSRIVIPTVSHRILPRLRIANEVDSEAFLELPTENSGPRIQER